MRRAIPLLIVWPLLLAQMCNQPPIPVVSGPLEPGAYTGTGEATVRWVVADQADTTTEQIDLTALVGTDGWPASDDGLRVAVGDTDTLDIGICVFRMTVTAITAIEGGLQIEWAMQQFLDDPSIPALTGTGYDTYTMIGPGRLHYSSALNMGATIGAEAAIIHYHLQGDLTRP